MRSLALDHALQPTLEGEGVVRRRGQIHIGDCLDVMSEMPSESVDPYRHIPTLRRCPEAHIRWCLAR